MSFSLISRTLVVFFCVITLLVNIKVAHCGELTADRKSINSGATLIKKVDEYSGFTCEPFRYESRRDANQTLGFVNKKVINNSSLSKSGEYFDPYGDRNKNRSVKAKRFKKRVAKKSVVTPTPEVIKVETVRANKVDAVKEVKLDSVTKSESTTKQAQSVTKSNPKIEVSKREAKTQTIAQVIESTEAPSAERFEIRFNSDATALNEDNKKVLSKVAEKALKDTKLFVKIKSYTPNKSGRVSEMKRKSLQRAIKARKQLIESGVSPVRISVNSVGSDDTVSGKLELLLENIH